MESITQQGVFHYIPTPEEMQWLDWAAENYEIAILLSSSVVTRGHLPPALLMSVYDIQEALTKDGTLPVGGLSAPTTDMVYRSGG